MTRRHPAQDSLKSSLEFPHWQETDAGRGSQRSRSSSPIRLLGHIPGSPAPPWGGPSSANVTQQRRGGGEIEIDSQAARVNELLSLALIKMIRMLPRVRPLVSSHLALGTSSCGIFSRTELTSYSVLVCRILPSLPRLPQRFAPQEHSSLAPRS